MLKMEFVSWQDPEPPSPPPPPVPYSEYEKAQNMAYRLWVENKKLEEELIDLRAYVRVSQLTRNV